MLIENLSFSETRKPNCLNPVDTSLWDREWWHYGNPGQNTGVLARRLLPTESVARDPPYMLTAPAVLTMGPRSRKARCICHTVSNNKPAEQWDCCGSPKRQKVNSPRGLSLPPTGPLCFPHPPICSPKASETCACPRAGQSATQPEDLCRVANSDGRIWPLLWWAACPFLKAGLEKSLCQKSPWTSLLLTSILAIVISQSGAYLTVQC